MTTSTAPETAPTLGIISQVDDDHVIKTQIVRAALELEVVPAIAAGHHDAGSIARATSCSSAGVRALLDAMCVVGLLRWSEDGYALTPTAEAYLVPSSPAYCAPIFLDDLRAWDGFVDTIRTGLVQRDYASAESDRIWAAYAAHQLANWPNDLPIYRARWKALGITAASMPGPRVLDVGCGSALPTLALAVDIPGATVTGLDRRPVIEVAGRLAETLGVESRASFVAGDVTSLQGLAGSFDIVHFGHMFKFLDPDEIRMALRQAHRLLTPAGRVVICEVFGQTRDYSDADQYLTAVWVFNVAPKGRIYTLAEYAAMLGEAGFRQPRRLEGAPWLQAERGA